MGLWRQGRGTPQCLYWPDAKADRTGSEGGVHDAKAAELLTLPLVVISHLVTFCRIG